MIQEYVGMAVLVPHIRETRNALGSKIRDDAIMCNSLLLKDLGKGITHMHVIIVAHHIRHPTALLPI